MANTNEPEFPALLKKSFAFVATAGMRLAPEVLLHELFRETFYEYWSGNSVNEKQRELDPLAIDNNNLPCFSKEERAVLYAMRGRKKLNQQSRDNEYYAPAYPQLTKHSWLRRKSDRVIKSFLFGGPLNQYFHGFGDKGTELAGTIDLLFGALVGHNSATTGESGHDKEILSLAIHNRIDEVDAPAVKEKLKSLITGNEGDESQRVFLLGEDDPLAKTITEDLICLCKAEKNIPRYQWIGLFMAFIRIALPCWLLSHMRITSLIKDWAFNAIEGGKIPSEQEICEAIKVRNMGLFHPTATYTREVFLHVEDYMKSRIELNLLLAKLDEVASGALDGKILTVSKVGATCLPVHKLIELARSKNKELRLQFGDGPIATSIARVAEQHNSWRRPLDIGQGKNFDEFFRILYKSIQGDQGESYLLTPFPKSPKKGFIVFPGAQLTKLFAFLAAGRKCENGNGTFTGRLVMSDLENQFERYGIDFKSVSGARPRLIKSLLETGMLKGSPDAGDSVEISCPFRASLER